MKILFKPILLSTRKHAVAGRKAVAASDILALGLEMNKVPTHVPFLLKKKKTQQKNP